jgi:hypothetical protein
MRRKSQSRQEDGCLVVIPQNLMLDQRVRLFNLAGKQTIEAVIVWKGQERSDGWELGIKLLNPHRFLGSRDLGRPPQKQSFSAHLSGIVFMSEGKGSRLSAMMRIAKHGARPYVPSGAFFRSTSSCGISLRVN